jgi:hypothetical protein
VALGQQQPVIFIGSTGFASANVQRATWARRLSQVRRFATWLSAHDPRTQIPPARILAAACVGCLETATPDRPGSARRATGRGRQLIDQSRKVGPTVFRSQISLHASETRGLACFGEGIGSIDRCTWRAHSAQRRDCKYECRCGPTSAVWTRPRSLACR